MIKYRRLYLSNREKIEKTLWCLLEVILPRDSSSSGEQQWTSGSVFNIFSAGLNTNHSISFVKYYLNYKTTFQNLPGQFKHQPKQLILEYTVPTVDHLPKRCSHSSNTNQSDSDDYLH